MMSVVQSINDMPNSHNPTQTPRTIKEGIKLDLTKQQHIPFGTLAMFHIAGKAQNGIDKFLPRSELGIVLGPSPTSSHAVRCYLFHSKDVRIRHHFTVLDRVPVDFEWKVKDHLNPSRDQFLVHTFQKATVSALRKRRADASTGSAAAPTQIYLPEPPPAVTSALQQPAPVSVPSVIMEVSADRVDFDPDHAEEGSILVPVPPIASRDSSAVIDDHQAEKRLKLTEDSIAEIIQQPPPSTAPVVEEAATTAGRQRRKTTGSWKDGPAKIRAVLQAYRISVTEALQGPYAAQSKDAILDEIRNMLDYQVGHYVRKRDIPLQYRNNILGSFMFLKHKHKPDGTYQKTKARFVGDGSRQGKHMYDLISSSTVALTSVFMLLNIASYFKAKVSAYDIKGAFLNAKFTDKDEPTYLVVRPDIASLWVLLDPSAKPFLTERGELYLCLDKFIYGMKQAPKKFEEDLHGRLIALGYTQCQHDECVFVKRTDHGFSILSTHVDDILQVTNSDELREQLRSCLTEAYTTIDYHENADSYLGMTLQQSPDRSSITLSQLGLTKSILERCAKEGWKPVNTPAAPNLFDEVEEDNPLLEDNKEFLSIIMTLMYLARLTRPDLLLPVTYLASRAHSPRKSDLKKLERVIKYLLWNAAKRTYHPLR
jgi:hypothetical protein